MQRRSVSAPPKLTLVVSISVALTAIVSAAQAQSFNIDAGAGPSPSAAYGAGAGQPGIWNVATGTGAPVWLTDLAGSPTGVVLLYPDVGWDATFDHPGTAGDDAALLDDFINWPPSTPVSFLVQGLAPGLYAFYSYAFAPNGANTMVDVSGSVEGAQLLGGTWSGSHELGVTYALHTRSVDALETVAVTVWPWNGVWGGFSGLQIVQVPEPASAMLLGLAGLPFLRRRR